MVVGAGRPARGGTRTGRVADLLAYYLGSSVFGTLSGVAWSRGGWGLVVTVVGVLFVAALGCAVALRRVPSLFGRGAPDMTTGH